MRTVAPLSNASSSSVLDESMVVTAPQLIPFAVMASNGPTALQELTMFGWFAGRSMHWTTERATDDVAD